MINHHQICPPPIIIYSPSASYPPPSTLKQNPLNLLSVLLSQLLNQPRISVRAAFIIGASSERSARNDTVTPGQPREKRSSSSNWLELCTLAVTYMASWVVFGTQHTGNVIMAMGAPVFAQYLFKLNKSNETNLTKFRLNKAIFHSIKISSKQASQPASQPASKQSDKQSSKQSIKQSVKQSIN